jgi:endonuclease/exonuclease/phosphatase family metal-dependent hydrolase
MPELNLLSLNICVHLPGGRNAYNISLIKNSIVLVFVLSNVLLLLPSVPYPKGWDEEVWQRLLIHVATLPAAMAFGQPLALLFSAVIYCFRKTTFSEFKTERIDHLYDTQILHKYDVLCLQELYGGWFPGSQFYQDYMKRQCTRAGLAFSAFAGRPVLPRIVFDQGLAIFSKHPIARSKRLVFKRQSIWDYMFVSRACLYAEILVPAPTPADPKATRSVHCFTLHTAPSLKDMQERTSLAKLLKEKVPTVQMQANEIAAFVKDMSSTCSASSGGNSSVLCMGDFNIEAATDDYLHLESQLGSANGLNLRDVTAKVGKGGSKVWTSTFGNIKSGTTDQPTEHLLTSPGLLCKPQTLDFIWVSPDVATVGESVVHPFAAVKDEDRKNWQQVSDHCGVSVKVKL